MKIQEKIQQIVKLMEHGSFENAQALIQIILKKDPFQVDILYLSAAVEANLGNLDKADKILAKVLAKNNRHFGALYTKANILQNQSKHSEAIKYYDCAIKQKPNDIWAILNRGNSQAHLKNFDLALLDFNKVINLNQNLFSGFLNKANVLREMEKFNESLESYEKTLQLNSSCPEAWSNRGIVLHDLERFEEAAVSCERALELKPEYAEAWNNRGSALHGLQRFEEALASSERALELKPEYAEAWSNRGSALCGLERFEEAIAHFDQALRLNPDLSDSALNKSILLFLRGDYKNAFDLYEARWKSTGFGSPPLQSIKPRWTGERNVGRLLIWAEQGIGDQILYGSMLNELRNFPQKKIISVTKKLIPLFQRSFPDYQIVDKKEVLSDELYDEHVPIGSIGKFLREDVDSFKKATYPYLVNNLSQTQQIKSLPQFKGKKVCGIAWRSSNKKVGRDKSISLIDLLPILSNYDMQYVNLQYGDTTEDVENLKKIYQPALYAVPEIDTFDDIDGVVSIMSACDLIITTSNTTAHLAGALNKETLLLIPRNIGKFWYWQGIEGVSLWYPSIRVFQQQKQGDWVSPINEIRTHLDNLDKLNNNKRD